MSNEPLIQNLIERYKNNQKQQRVAKLIIEDGVLRSYDGSLNEIAATLDFLGVTDEQLLEYLKA